MANRSFIVALPLAFLLFPLFAFRSLDTRTETPSWKLVASGEIAASPVNTSYGFAMLTDGRVLCGFGKSGQLLWKKNFSGKPSGYLATESDFLLVVTNKDTLNLVNPSGTLLWQVKTGFEIIENPRMARDGRILVRGNEHIACYSLHGVRKWLVRTEKQRSDVPLMLFDDGSIFAFLSATENNKTRAARYTVFGQESEITTFTAYVTAACETKYGALLALAGGGAGLCAVKDGTAVSEWVTTGVTGKECATLALFSGGEQAAFFWQSGAKNELALSFLEVKDGVKGELVTLGTLSLCDLTHISTHKAGIALADATRAILVSADGALAWEAQLPKKNTFAGVFYTNDDALVVYRKDWLMQAFTMLQSTTAPASHTGAHHSYAEKRAVVGTIGRMGYERIASDELQFMKNSFLRGDYSEKEAEWASRLHAELGNWCYDLQSGKQRFYDGNSYFIENPVYAENLISAAAACGTADFAALFADVLTVETRTAIITKIVQACGALGWDDEGVMLTAIAEVLHKTNPRNTVLLKTICDATYEICKYMGKPTLLSKGKNLISFMLFPQFDSTTRDYARKTLQNILDLRL